MDAVLAWLLDPADPAVRARTLVDLMGRAPDDADVEEARRAMRERGSAARALSGLAAGPRDARRLYRPKYGATVHRLVALAEMGVTASDPLVAEALEACVDVYLPDPAEREVCITGNLCRAAWRMGRGDDPRVWGALQWLVDTQINDGGWHCWPDEVPHGTLDGWEALGAFAAVPPERRPPDMRDAIRRGVQFFLEQRLGLDDPYEPWRRLHFPRHYYYDVLVGLELVTELGDPRDARLGPALDWLERRRGKDGRWWRDAEHPDMAEGAGYALRADERITPLVVEEPNEPSRWLTLAALRVLRRAGRA